MKQKRLLFAAIGIAAIALANATTWRINPDPKAKAKFTSVEQAMKDKTVAEGDTLILDPGAYGDIELTKDNITVIGPGYFLDQKEGWYEKDMAIIKNAYLSNWSTIEGCVANNITAGTNSTIRRCNAQHITNSSLYDSYLVEQCFVTERLDIRDYCKVRNNIVLGYIYSGKTCDGMVIENNTVICSGSNACLEISATNSIARNNIFINTYGSDDTSIYNYRGVGLSIHNNVTSNNRVQEYVYDKVIDATVESLFVNDGSIDSRWQLSENSPAKGAGANGEDCGAFAGSNPYVLSGLPRFIPHITRVEVPARPTNGKLNIKIKIENQDE